MIRHLFLLYLSSLLFFPLVHAQEAAPLSEQGAMEHLFSQIGHGEVLYRDDIIHDALKRLYRIAPDHPRGILAEVRLAVRLGDDGEAQKQLERLHRVAPESDEYKDAALLVELSSSESSEVLAQARLLSMVGRYDEARQHYDTLLQGRYPTPELAQEYWQMRVNQEGGHQTAIAQLSTSLARFPNHPALLRALVTFHFAVEEPDQAYAYLGVLARSRNERDWAADREYEYLNSLPVSEHSHDLWADYLIRYAGLQSMTDRAQGKLNHYQALLNDPDWRAGQEGINLVEREQHPARALLLLEQALQSYPDDVEVIGSAGLAALRLGRRQQALQYFDRAIETERHDDRKSRWM